MRFFALASIVLAALAAAVSAEVSDGDKFKCGSHGTVTASVEVDAIFNTANVKFTRDGSESTSTTGTPGPSGGNTCDETDGTMKETDAEGDELECRVDDDGDWQFKNDNGDWVDAGKPRKGLAPAGSQFATAGGGSGGVVVRVYEEVTSLPLLSSPQGQTVPPARLRLIRPSAVP